MKGDNSFLAIGPVYGALSLLAMSHLLPVVLNFMPTSAGFLSYFSVSLSIGG